VAISAAMPNRIYALIEAKPGSGLYRSDDAGTTWSLVNARQPDHATFYYEHSAWIPPIRTCSSSATKVVQERGRRQDVSAFTRAARRPSRSLDQPRNSQYMVSQTTAAPTFRWMAAHLEHAGEPATAEIYQVAVDNQYPTGSTAHSRTTPP